MLKLLIDANQNDPSKIANYTPPAVPSESSLPPPLPNINAQWLYDRISKARITASTPKCECPMVLYDRISESRSAGKMGDNIPQTLVLAEVALKVIQNVKAEGYEEDLCEKLEALVDDDGLTADELKKLVP